TSIIATALTMLETSSGTEQGEFIAMMQAQCRLIEQVTSDLAVAAKTRQHAVAVSAHAVDVLPALRLAATAFAGQAEVFVTCPLGLTVFVDEIRLQQMLGNLISNAIKYGEPPIRLVALAALGAVEFRVVDSGPGVPDDFRPLLFQPFARASG